jgi:hypothetical protein
MGVSDHPRKIAQLTIREITMLLFKDMSELRNYLSLTINEISRIKEGTAHLVSWLWAHGRLFPVNSEEIIFSELTQSEQQMLQLGIEIGKILSEAKAQRQSTY